MAAVTADVSAVDFGVGVSAKSDDSWIYFPIEITPKLRLEPSIRFSQSNSKLESEDTQFGFPVTTTVKSDFDQLQIGLGVFGVLPVKDSIRVYYGARAAYIDAETSTKQTTRFESDFFEDEVTFKNKSSADGYRIAPTLGFEYFLTERFSIGGEAEWFYEDISQDSSFEEDSVEAEGTSIDQDRNGTETHLIVRYRF